jgi:hypothetical protein
MHAEKGKGCNHEGTETRRGRKMEKSVPRTVQFGIPN